MPYHVCGVVHRCRFRGTVLYASVPDDQFEVWTGYEDFVDFPPLPIRTMVRGEYFYGSFDELCSAVALEDETYTKFNVFKENHGGLRLYYFRNPPGCWCIYDLVMPIDPPCAARNTYWPPYPQPCAWHYAEGRKFVCVADDFEMQSCFRHYRGTRYDGLRAVVRLPL